MSANPELPKLPPRDPSGHKGTFGTVGVLGGQAAPPRVMIGGPAFTAAAALRTGAGLAVLAVPEPIVPAALVIAPGATGLALPVGADSSLRPSDVAELLDEHLSRFTCLAVGPGWGFEFAQQQIIARLLALDAPPMVVDADALNAMAVLPIAPADFRAPAILTPHPGEYRRLASSLGIGEDPVDPSSRPGAAEELARRLGCVVVLKGPGTVVTDGITTAVNETGSAALATAGTGDVLTGVIAGLVAQFCRPGGGGELSLLECARLGVHIHGLVADRWVERHGASGLAAEDLIALLPDVMTEVRGQCYTPPL